MDQAPTEIYAQLLDEGEHHCSIRTMYRVLTENTEVRELYVVLDDFSRMVVG